MPLFLTHNNQTKYSLAILLNKAAIFYEFN
jgi:hypothetical protein